MSVLPQKATKHVKTRAYSVLIIRLGNIYVKLLLFHSSLIHLDPDPTADSNTLNVRYPSWIQSRISFRGIDSFYSFPLKTLLVKGPFCSIRQKRWCLDSLWIRFLALNFNATWWPTSFIWIRIQLPQLSCSFPRNPT